MVKQSAFLMREYGGRERAVHAGNISASRPLSTEQQRDIANLRGHVQSNWQTIRDLTAGAASPLASAVPPRSKASSAIQGSNRYGLQGRRGGHRLSDDGSAMVRHVESGARIHRSDQGCRGRSHQRPRRREGCGGEDPTHHGRARHLARRRCRLRLYLDPVAPRHPSLDRHDGRHAASRRRRHVDRRSGAGARRRSRRDGAIGRGVPRQRHQGERTGCRATGGTREERASPAGDGNADARLRPQCHKRARCGCRLDRRDAGHRRKDGRRRDREHQQGVGRGLRRAGNVEQRADGGDRHGRTVRFRRRDQPASHPVGGDRGESRAGSARAPTPRFRALRPWPSGSATSSS